MTAWGYFDDKKHGAEEEAKPSGIKESVGVSQSTENSPNSQQANAGGQNNVIAQATGGGTVIVNSNAPAFKRLVPMEIEAPPDDFTGREEEITELVDAVGKGGATIVGLQGMGGIGKTALAQKIAQILKPKFPDGQIYLDLKGAMHEQDIGQTVEPLTPNEALGRILASFGEEVDAKWDLDERGKRYRTLLSGKRALLLMDNARDGNQVKPLRPPEGSVWIITSRQIFAVSGLVAKNLDALPPPQACELLLKIEPRIGDTASQMAKLCGYLPLAVRAVASALNSRRDVSPAEFLSRMKAAEWRVHEAGVKLAFTTSADLLDSPTRGLWYQLSVFPGTFDVAGTAAVWQVDASPAKEALSKLLAFSLVEWNSETARYRLHDLARDFTALQLDEASRMAAQGRHAAYYKDVLVTAGQEYRRGGSSIFEGLALFDLEWNNIQAGQAWAARNSWRGRAAAELCVAYPYVAADVLFLRQTPREQIKWLEIAVDAARKLGDRQGEGYASGNLGSALSSVGEHRCAIEFLEKSLAIKREIADHQGEANTLGNLGIAYKNLGEYRRAIEFYEQALEISREIGERHSEGNTLGNLGSAYRSLGEYRRAIDLFKQRLKIAQESRDRRGEGAALGNLGIAYYSLGDYRRAIEFYEQALEISREIGDREGEGNALWNSALSLDKLGERTEAVRRA
ncbi:MAG: tetratricopeptide repeat protein [Candidatus Binataceae bacterium]